MFHQLGSTINGHFKPISFAFHSNKSIFGERIKDFEHTVMLTVMIIVLSYDNFINAVTDRTNFTWVHLKRYKFQDL